MTDPCVERALQAMADDAMSSDVVGFTGFGVLTITDEQGRVVSMQEFDNILTTAGDQFYAKKIITAIAPAAAVAPTAVTGMKLGTSTTAASKSGAGAALGAYISGANATFASGFPTALANTGTDTGWLVTYQVVWSAASFASTNVNEVAIVTDAGTNATSTAANTIARAVFPSTQTKTSGQLATVTWSHTILGA